MKKNLILLIAIIIIWKSLNLTPAVELGPGVKAAEIPIQTNIEKPKPFQHNDYQITPLADFSITAKVLAKKNYRFDKEADISPVDLALGWGNMSDEAVLEHIEIRQSNRWYRWNSKQYPIPRREIETSSANMHMVPANESVRTTLKQIHPGEIIQLRGKLIRVNSDQGYYWQSSMTREDTGAGACELIWVEELKVING